MQFAFSRSGIHDKNTNRDIKEQVTDNNFIIAHACMHAMLLQSCPTLCDPVDRSPARDSPGKNTGVGFHALLQVVFLKWIEPAFLKSPGVAGRFFTTRKTWESHYFPYLLFLKNKI